MCAAKSSTDLAAGFSGDVPLGERIPLDPPPAADSLRFPPGFRFGVSTSAYQTEGDNRGSDLWEWERKKRWEISGKASNSWEMWEEDLRRAAALGVTAYRFSIEWGRCVPSEGTTDPAALARYRAIVERCLSLGMRPIVCLHHFTHPAWLLARLPRLWEEAAIVEHFVAWAKTALDALPMVRDWVPFNEPNVYLSTGYVIGQFPPGRRLALGPARALLVGPARHMALAHRRVFDLVKGRSPESRVGIAQNFAITAPLVPGRDDAAARAWDRLMHWSLLDAIVTGRMDADLDGIADLDVESGLDLAPSKRDEVGRNEDVPPPIDWIGVNYYTRVFVRRVPLALRPACALPLYSDMVVMAPLSRPLYRLATRGRTDREEDDMAREQVPEGLAACLEAAWRRYRLPLMVTENGVADEAGTLRARSLAAHLEAVRRAIASGVPVEGYLYWSLLDNYEWGTFKPRFGLHRVDYTDGFRRTLTEGGRVYGEVARRHAGMPAGTPAG